MPNFAYVRADVRCLSCDSVVANQVMFQWGHCPAMIDTEEGFYSLDDSIHWRHCADDSIRPWVYFKEGKYYEEANIGDPAYANLIVRDTSWLFSWTDPADRRRCVHCGEPIEGAAVEIREGVIRRAWIYGPGELGQTPGTYGQIPPDYTLILDDGRLQPMLEWEQREMEVIDNC